MKEILNEINSKLKSNKWSDNVFVFLLILVVLSFIYAPVFKSYYLFSDDYTGFFMNMIKSRNMFLRSGRPLSWLINILSSKMALNVDEVNYFRFLAVIGFASFSFMFFLFFKRLKVSVVTAIMFAIIFSLLPGFQENISYSTTWFVGFGYSISLIAGISTVNYLEKIDTINSKKNILIKIHIPGIILLIIINLLYQPLTLIYWLIGLLYLLIKYPFPEKVPAKIIFLYIINGLLALLLYFLLYKLISVITELPPDHRSVFISLNANDIYLKLNYLLNVLIINLNLFWLDLNIYRVILVTMFVIIGVFFRYKRDGSSFKMFEYIKYLFLILLLTVLSFYPFIILTINQYATRNFGPLSIFILFFFIYGVFYLLNFLIKSKPIFERVKLLFLFIILIVAGHTANSNIYHYMVMPQSLEFRYLIGELRRADLSRISRIHMIQPPQKWVISSKKMPYKTLTFGTTTSNRNWCPDRMLRVAFREIDYPNKQSIYFSKSKAHENYEVDSNTLIIDMRNIYNLRNGNGNKNCRVKIIPWNEGDTSAVLSKNIILYSGFSGKLFNGKANKYGFYGVKDYSKIVINSRAQVTREIYFGLFTQFDNQEVKLELNGIEIAKINLIKDSLNNLILPLDLNEGRNNLILKYSKYNDYQLPIYFTKIKLTP